MPGLNSLYNENMNRWWISHTLRKLFVKLLPDGENKEKNLEYVDALLKQISEDKVTVESVVVSEQTSIEKPIVESEAVLEVVPEVVPVPLKEGVQQNVSVKKDKEVKKKEKKLSRQEEAADALTKKKEQFDCLSTRLENYLNLSKKLFIVIKNVYELSSQELDNLKIAKKLLIDSLAYYDRSFIPCSGYDWRYK